MRRFIKLSNLNSLKKRFDRFFAVPSVKAKNHSSLRLSNRGSALVMAVVLMLVASTLITIGVKLIANASRTAKERELYVGEAENVARAGLIDAKGWFIRQTANGGVVFGNTVNTVLPGMTPTVNPTYSNVDQAFNPLFNAGNPQNSDTTDPTIGIVSEYPLNDAVTANALFWARYEVKRQQAGAYDPNAVHDVTGSRSSYVNGDGMVWNIVSTGYVYKRMDKSVTGIPATWVYPYNYGVTTGDYSKTKIIATARFSTEIRKLSLIMPVPAPPNGPGVANLTAGIYVQDLAAQITLNTQTLMDGAVSATGTVAGLGENHP
jgi:hypothetical protein